MSVEKAVEYMITKDLREMNKELGNSLTSKAFERLEERKIELAKTYFAKK